MDAMMTSSADVWVRSIAMTAYGVLMMILFTQDPPEQVIKDCTAEVSQVLRFVVSHLYNFGPYGIGSVLKRDGIFIYITFGQPHFRRRYLTGAHVTRETSLEINQLGESFHYFMYTLRML